jgi:DNA-binding SARP family transcriptional activator
MFGVNTAQVTLRLIGPVEAEVGGAVLAGPALGSRQARVLLAFLGVEHGRLARVGRIAEVLWGEERPYRPERNIATHVSRLRAVLGARAVAGGRDGYRLGDRIGVDLYDAAPRVAQAEAWLAAGTPAQARRVAGAALAGLERGEVFEDDPYADWAQPARAVHERLVRRARHTAAEAALRLGDVLGAQAVAEAAVIADALDEIAHRTLMRAFGAAGEPVQALIAYDSLRRRLADELGVDPAPATQEVHAAILRGQPVPA